MTKPEHLKESKAEMSRWVNFQIMKMREYCKRNQIQNSDIAEKCGLHTAQVWRFINQKSPEMSIVTFLLIAKAIGFEFSFTIK